MAAMAEHSEHRRWVRTILHAPLVIQWRTSGKQGLGMVTNMSPAGCYVLTQATADAGERLVVQLEGSELPELESDVRFVDPDVGMGLEFANVPRQAVLQIERFLEIHAPA
jgi:hypothetical protein